MGMQLEDSSDKRFFVTAIKRAMLQRRYLVITVTKAGLCTTFVQLVVGCKEETTFCEG